MKRRGFLLASCGAVASVATRGVAAEVGKPCPPPAIGVVNGPTTQTSCPNSGTAPSWYTAMTSGQWNAMPAGSVLDGQSVVEANGPSGGSINAFSSGFLHDRGFYDFTGAYRTGTYLMIWGGGHGDYGGNSIYAYGPIDGSAPSWTRVNNRTPESIAYANALPGSYGAWYSDGLPAVPHTYDGLVYAPSVNRMYSLNCKSPYRDTQSGTSFADSVAWDFTIAEGWQDARRGWTGKVGGGANPYALTPVPNNPGAGNAVCALYDARREVIWWTDAFENTTLRKFYQFSPARNSWTTATVAGLPQRVGAVCAANTSALSGGVAAYSFAVYQTRYYAPAPPPHYYIFNLDAWSAAASHTMLPLSVTNPALGPMQNGTEEAQALAWSPYHEGFIVGSVGLGSLWLLKPNDPANPTTGTWTWKVLYSGGTPYDKPFPFSGYGPIGRFAYVDSNGVRGIVCQHRTSAPIYFWKF